MRKLAFYCDRGSKGLSNLVKDLREKGVPCIRIKRNNSQYNYNPENPIINWGSTRMPMTNCTVLNKASAISKACNKVKAFEYLTSANVPCLSYTTSLAEAEEWINDDETVYVRTLTRAYQGKGIIVAPRL